MFRRGKPSNRPEATVLVEKTASTAVTTTTNGGSSSLALSPVIAVAQVKRNFLGTGPFDKHWFNYDCCGIVCALFTYMLHVYGVYCVCVVLVPPWMSEFYEIMTMDGSTQKTRFLTATGRFTSTLFCLLAFLACAAHFKAMTTDPGAVPPDARPLADPADDVFQSKQQQESTDAGSISTMSNSDGILSSSDMASVTSKATSLEAAHVESLLTTPSKTKRLCRKCKAFKPQRAHHCSVCRRCIIKMDHHCPWVNNCVGIGNHKYFLLFCFYTFLTCIVSLILVVFRFSTCVSNHRSHYHYHRGGSHEEQVASAAAMAGSTATQASCLDQPSDLLLVLGLLIEALLFGMFTSCMMADQMEVVYTKLTHIDRLKGTEVGGNLQGVAEVFGVGRRREKDDRFRPDWLSPFHKICFPESVNDQVMGFCRPILNNLGCTNSSGIKETELSTTPLNGTSNNGRRHISDLV
ncbi:hypothetical protein MPSEU_001097300 [Mayamaea pseudoterrestris]|nr:hypothetical protein MPSEU_001097300 [Mayamaea pseudoterrestris]